MADRKETAFIKLIVAGEPKILGYLVSLLPTIQDAEDLMQETSVVMWEKFDEFLATQDEEPSLGRFVAWGNKIAFYKVLNTRRAKRWSLRLLSADVIELVSAEWERQEASGALDDRRAALAGCLDELPETRRDVLQDYYWKRSPVDQIADKDSRTAGSVYKLLQRARMALHKCIERKTAASRA